MIANGDWLRNTHSETAMPSGVYSKTDEQVKDA
jgi:hypothetical protein